jgi:hypothetical protein
VIRLVVKCEKSETSSFGLHVIRSIFHGASSTGGWSMLAGPLKSITL